MGLCPRTGELYLLTQDAGFARNPGPDAGPWLRPLVPTERNRFARPRKGRHDELVAFFDAMAAIMAGSKPIIEKPIVSENADYLIEAVDCYFTAMAEKVAMPV